MTSFIEWLEGRRLFAMVLTGGPGHTGVAVDVRNPDGSVAGVLYVDYYAAGFFGETAGTEGSSSGNVVTGTQGRLSYSYIPGRSVSSAQDGVVIPGDAAADARVAEMIRLANGPNAAVLAMSGERVTEVRVDAADVPGEAFSNYRVTQCNCYRFSSHAIEVYVNGDRTGNALYDSVVQQAERAKEYFKALAAQGQANESVTTASQSPAADDLDNIVLYTGQEAEEEELDAANGGISAA